MVWNKKTCVGEALKLKFDKMDTVISQANSQLEGVWRLPKRDELEKIVCKDCKKVKINSKKDIIIAYEPVWSIGTGLIPKSDDLYETVNFIKKKMKKNKVLYGGSVNPKNINDLKLINNIDGYLIGGASQDPKKFIDIIKKRYS